MKTWPLLFLLVLPGFPGAKRAVSAKVEMQSQRSSPAHVPSFLLQGSVQGWLQLAS